MSPIASPTTVSWLAAHAVNAPTVLIRRASSSAERVRHSGFDLYPDEQILTLQILGGFALFMLFITAFQLKAVILPWILFHTIIHEMGHALTQTLVGHRVIQIKLDADGGGVTRAGGWDASLSREPKALLTLPAGYIFQGIFGGALVFCGFSLLASEIATFAILVLLLLFVVFARKGVLELAIPVFIVISLIPWWFFYRAYYLRFYVLWLGSVNMEEWVIMWQTLILNEQDKSDATRFAELFGGSPKFWGFLWLMICVALTAGAIVGGIITFHQSKKQQLAIAERFIPAFAPNSKHE